MSNDESERGTDHRRPEGPHGDERSAEDRRNTAPADDPESPGATIDDDMPAEPNEPA
jgi:hypothetical protein